MKRLAVLSNVNMDPLKNHLKKNGFSDLYFAGFNQWQAELLNPEAGLLRFAPDYVFVYLNVEEQDISFSTLYDAVRQYLQAVPQTTFIISNVNTAPYSVLTYSFDYTRAANEFNALLGEATSDNERIITFDFNRLINYYGYQQLFDDKFWYLGRIRLSDKGFISLARELCHTISAIEGRSCKVLVLDLDNTLWGGVVGEEGAHHIQIGHEGTGLIYRDFQKKIKQLKDAGILLAVCSKNNEADAREVFEQNKNMVLSWDDFVLHYVNWNNKADNISEIARKLNLGLDSVVFIDDSIRERELVKQQLPEVSVPDFPEDVSVLNRWFAMEVAYSYFSRLKLTNEDKSKTEQYKRNIERTEAKKTLNYEEYLAQLDICLNVFEVDNTLALRISQLTQKTNQFNLTVKRYNEVDILSMIEHPACKVYACEYKDRFGAEGVVGCVIVELRQQEACIDTFLLSCRVLGRNVEKELLHTVISRLQESGVKTITASYTPTAKNRQVKDFYTDNGFVALEDNRFIYSLA